MPNHRSSKRLVLIKGAGEPETFATDDPARVTGIYRVIHSAHRLPHEVVILQGERFPRCSKCSESVRFQLLQAVIERPVPGQFRIALYELPEIEADDEAA